MAWNQQGPGNKDPWGQGNGQNGPPDLDQVIRDLQKKLGGLFGKGSSRGSGGSGAGSGKGKMPFGRTGGTLLAIVVLGLWIASGFYVVDQSELGVELRFGKYQEVMPAVHDAPDRTPKGSVEAVVVDRDRPVPHFEQTLLQKLAPPLEDVPRRLPRRHRDRQFHQERHHRLQHVRP